MYHLMSRLAISGVYEFYMEHQMLIVLNSLLEKWMLVQLSLEYRLESLDFNNLVDVMLVRLSLEYRLESLDFNNLADVMLLERECE